VPGHLAVGVLSAKSHCAGIGSRLTANSKAGWLILVRWPNRAEVGYQTCRVSRVRQRKTSGADSFMPETPPGRAK